MRPLVWLLVFAAGFRAVLGISIIPPYETYITYEIYIVPGLIGMIQLFNGMQSSLSMVYDREMGSMRVLLTTPLPRWFLLLSKLSAGVAVSILQVYAFLLIAWLFGIEFDVLGYVLALPAIVLSGLMLGAVGMFISSTCEQLENFAGVMNFVIFPAFFLSSALYPLWHMRESSLLLYRDFGGKPLHACGGAGPLRALPEAQSGIARRRARLPRRFLAARGLGLQAGARHGAEAAGRRSSGAARPMPRRRAVGDVALSMFRALNTVPLRTQNARRRRLCAAGRGGRGRPEMRRGLFAVAIAGLLATSAGPAAAQEVVRIGVLKFGTVNWEVDTIIQNSWTRRTASSSSWSCSRATTRRGSPSTPARST